MPNPTTALRESLATEIRVEMVRKNRKQQDLAEVLGISQSSVSQRLNGKQPLDVEELLAIAEWLDVDPAEWLRAAS